MIFTHTNRERGLWRGWLRNGQSVEISTKNRGWDFGGGIHVHETDDDTGSRMLFLKLWRLTVVLPLGITAHPWPVMEGPQWSAYASSEFGLAFHWGLRRKSFDWPWNLYCLAYQEQMPDGSWREVQFEEDPPYSEVFSYLYTLRSGRTQTVTATVTKRRHILCRRAFKRLRWPRWSEESINVNFSGEVGERAGSWKGGTIGCGYSLQAGETMEQCLRRMEMERKFT